MGKIWWKIIQKALFKIIIVKCKEINKFLNIKLEGYKEVEEKVSKIDA